MSSMAFPQRAGGSTSASASASGVGSGSGSMPGKQTGKPVRKRVKTGCLTCRRRRIKCGEQKPSCANCIKSGRECDYGVRLALDAANASRPSLSYPYPASASSLDGQSPSWPGPTFSTESLVATTSPELSMHQPQMPAMWSQPLQTPSATASWQADQLVAMPPYSSMPMQATPVTMWYGQSVMPPPQYQQPPVTESQAMFPSPSLAHQTPPGTWQSASYSMPVKHSPGQMPFHDSRLPRSTTRRFPAEPRVNFDNLLEVAAVEVQDDDYYDVFPEETVGEDALDDAQRRLVQAIHFRGGVPPTMSLEPYRAENAANPLRNPATARIFGHFVNYTGPALSVFERPVGRMNPEIEAEAVSEHRRTSWMYALPSLALHDNGLLHAMLALASFAMAKANHASTTPSVKHHSWSIRRVHRTLSEPGKRQEVTTLAATLLLGFYEILTADHMKWSAHLAGAKQLIIESNFRSLTSKIMKLKAEQAQSLTDSSAPKNLIDLDFSVIEKLIGKRLPRPDVSSGRQTQGRTRHLSASEWQDFALYQDLYWFYVRQDTIYALISGNNLLLVMMALHRKPHADIPDRLPFDQYATVLPRGPIGRPEACWGSFDHLMILVARIADFAVRDRERKIRTIRARQAAEKSAVDSLSAGPRDSSGAPFYGMAPSSGHARMPNAYVGQTAPRTGPVPPRPPATPETTARGALAEWEQIQDSLKHFASVLGPGFRPLQEPDYPSFDTPFGKAAIYPRYDIASLWMYYYMAMIVLIRAHPSHPPAAQLAAGAAARETAWFANEVARIASGIMPSAQPDPHPAFLGALASSMTPLFFAGIQYRDPGQRYWCVKRLCEISATCGWVTAEMCASGCETSWVRAAERGRGPPWTRIERDFGSLDPRSSHGRVSLGTDLIVDRFGRPKLQKAFGIIGEVDDVAELERLAI